MIDPKRAMRRIALPRQFAGSYLGTIVLRAPTLDESRLDIDDPVFTNTGAAPSF